MTPLDESSLSIRRVKNKLEPGINPLMLREAYSCPKILMEKI